MSSRPNEREKKTVPMWAFVVATFAFLIVAAMLLMNVFDSGKSNEITEVKTTDINLISYRDLLVPGEKGRVNYVCYPENSTQKVTFTSTDNSIVTVDDKGYIQAGRNEGKAQIVIASGDVAKTMDIVVCIHTFDGEGFEYNHPHRAFVSCSRCGDTELTGYFAFDEECEACKPTVE